VMATGYQWGALILFFCCLLQVQFHLGEHRLLSADWMDTSGDYLPTWSALYGVHGEVAVSHGRM
jgi:hypothetical protein